MIRRSVQGLVAALVLAFPITCTAPAFADTASDLTAKGIVIDAINAQRRSAGVAPVTASAAAEAVAQRWAAVEQSDGVMIHNPTFGQELGAQYAGEVLSMYYPADGVVPAWMNSSAHRGIVLSSTYTQAGVGYIADASTGYTWIVVDFVGAAPTSPDGNTHVGPGKAGTPTLTGVDDPARRTVDLTVAWSPPPPNGSAPITTSTIRFIDASTGQVMQYGQAAPGQTSYTWSAPRYSEHDVTYLATVTARNGYNPEIASDPSSTVFVQGSYPDPVIVPIADPIPVLVPTVAPEAPPDPLRLDATVPVPVPVAVGDGAGSAPSAPVVGETSPAPPAPARAPSGSAPAPTPVAPGAVRSVRVGVRAATATLTWRPASTRRGTAIRSYRVLVLRNGRTVRSVSLAPGRRSLRLAGLHPRTAYLVRIWTVNRAGRSSPAASHRFRVR